MRAAPTAIDPLTVTMLGGPQDYDQLRVTSGLRLVDGHRVPVWAAMLTGPFGPVGPLWQYGWYELYPGPSGLVGVWRAGTWTE